MRRHLAIALAALGPVVGLVGCRDYEQRARASGESLRAQVARACEKLDGGVELVEACVAEGCRASCGEAGVAKGFFGTCVAACEANAECTTDRDCAEGLRCNAIAPRVRRCAPR